MLVLKTIYKDGKAYTQVVDEKYRNCTTCGKTIEEWREMCDSCENQFNDDDTAMQNWQEATTK